MNLADAIKQVSAAVLRLHASIEGVTTVHTWDGRRIDFTVATDDLVLAWIDALGMARENVVSVGGDYTWIVGEVAIDGIRIKVSGPHTKIAKAEPARRVDVSGVAAAVEAAGTLAP